MSLPARLCRCVGVFHHLASLSFRSYHPNIAEAANGFTPVARLRAWAFSADSCWCQSSGSSLSLSLANSVMHENLSWTMKLLTTTTNNNNNNNKNPSAWGTCRKSSLSLFACLISEFARVCQSHFLRSLGLFHVRLLASPHGVVSRSRFARHRLRACFNERALRRGPGSRSFGNPNKHVVKQRAMDSQDPLVSPCQKNVQALWLLWSCFHLFADQVNFGRFLDALLCEMIAMPTFQSWAPSFLETFWNSQKLWKDDGSRLPSARRSSPRHKSPECGEWFYHVLSCFPR